MFTIKTFRTYVHQAYKPDSPEGDFMQDIMRDKQFPNSVSYDRIRTYLISLNACFEAMEAFDEVWLQYKRDIVK